jgi:EmrB/QacA subfamily drug resistance transporter
MCFALFMIMLDNTIVNVALPSIQRDLKTSPANLQWTIDAYILTFAALILLGGKLGDRFGRKRIFLVGLGIFTLASMLCALATSDSELIAARAFQGVGGALLNPLSLSIIASTFPRKQLPTAIGIWAGVSGLGLAVGPVAGGLLVEQVSWSAVFWINVPIGLVAVLVTLWAVSESKDPSTRHLDLTGTTLVTAGLAALVWALIKAGSHGWGSGYTLGFLGGAIALLALFIFWERRVDDPMLPLSFFRRRVFSVANAVVALVGFGMFGVIFFVSLYFQNVLDYSPLQAGVRSLPMTMMLMALAPLAGKINARIGPRLQLTIGMLLSSAGLFGLSRIGVHSSYNAIWPFYALMGAGLSFSMPAVSATGMAAVDPRKAGVASGVINASRQVGGALGIAVLGSLGAALTRSSWNDRLATLPAAVQSKLGGAGELVIGGQGAAVGRIAGPQAQAAAAAAFVHGVNGALLCGGALMLLAAVVAYFGLWGFKMPVQQEQPVTVEA